MEIRSCSAQSSNDILFVFPPPLTGLRLGDVVEFDHRIVEAQQLARNVTTGDTFALQLRKQDIHDLRLPATHSSSRLPSEERFHAP
jgi:hypothetical protein